MKLPNIAVSRSLAVALSAVAVFTTIPAAAQLVQSTEPNDAVDRLGRYIRVLAATPRDLEALLGAGQAALDVGDPNAALGFFARAEDVSASNGRVKAGLGSSLVMIERPDDALRLFAEAVALGVPEAAVARDRGLAYDLRGDSARAQRDYKLALGRDRDDELVRRYALSLGISGDRAAALEQLQPLLRKQDQGAWRARAFILAMTGDVSGANSVARQLMVPAMANAMSPLLSRLATLNAAERAHAVNFGTVPSDGTQLAVKTGDPFLGAVPPTPITASASTAGAGLIPAGPPLGPRTQSGTATRVAQAELPKPRQPITVQQKLASEPTPAAATPGFSTPAESGSSRVGQRIGTRIGPVDPARVAETTSGTPTLVARPTSGTLPPPDSARQSVPPVEVAQAPPPPPAVIGPPAEPVPTSSETPAFEVPRSTALPSSPPVERVIPAPSPSATSRLAGLLEGIERERESSAELPSARELRSARAAARKKVAELAAQTAAEAAAKKKRDEEAAAAKRSPARIWVQIATGRNESGLGLTWRRLQSDNAALKGQSAWFAPFKATNRIVVGPIKSASSARDLVNKLGKGGLQATTWSSEAGEDVTRIAGK
ncbi:MAG: SPOR domain-containing protein [Sphingomonadales bacterium]